MCLVPAAIREKTPSCSSATLLVAPRLRKEMPCARQSHSKLAARVAASAALATADSARVTTRTVCTS